MKLLISYIPFQVLLGVLLGIMFPVLNIYFICVLPVSIFIMMFLIHRFMMNHTFAHQIFFVFVLMFGMSLSWCSQVLRDDVSRPHHYTNFLNRPVTVDLSLVKELKQSKINKRFYAKVNSINDTVAVGKLLVEIPIKEVVDSELVVGDKLVCKTNLRTINFPTSPYDFNYKSYLAKQRIYAKIKLNKHYIKTGEETSLLIKLQKYRNSVTSVLDASSLSKSTVGLMKAMLLGDKDGITDEMTTAFTDSGVVHIIAISGMHVGVLYFMLLFTFGFIKRYKYGDYVYVALVLLCLWSFAVFSGLSSSVIRSVTMFSFFTLTKLKSGKRLVLEAVVTSMLILLLVDTNYIYNVGFQLSYTAVISIVVFYPLLSKWVKVNHKIAQYFIDVLVVSIIAQMGVLAFSLYYFHQIPLQFLVANFFAVSLLPLVLYGGIIVLLKVMLTIDETFIEISYDVFITFYLNTIQSFSSYSNWIIKDVSFKQTEVLCYYILLFCIWYVGNHFTFKRVKQATYLLIVCQVMLLVGSYQEKVKEELLIYNNYAHSLTTIKKGKELMVFGKDSLVKKDSIVLKYNQLRNNIKEYNYTQNEAFNYQGDTYLMIHETKPYHLISQKEMILIIGNNPKINVERLLVSVAPKLVIIEASNYKSNQLKWKSTCKKLQVPYYCIAELGAYVKN